MLSEARGATCQRRPTLVNCRGDGLSGDSIVDARMAQRSNPENNPAVRLVGFVNQRARGSQRAALGGLFQLSGRLRSPLRRGLLASPAATESLSDFLHYFDCSRMISFSVQLGRTYVRVT